MQFTNTLKNKVTTIIINSFKRTCRCQFLFSVTTAGIVQNRKPIQNCNYRCWWMWFARHFPLISTGSTQEDPSRHDWKSVDWDVKSQNKTLLGRGLSIMKKYKKGKIYK